jgi:hypothetical protein
MTGKLRLALASILAMCALGAIAPAASAYIYWTNNGNGTIGRANLNGGSPNQSFITGASSPFGLAVDGNYIYWTDLDTNTISRANLDGTGANPSFITGASNPGGLAVDDTYIYWTNGNGTIGRANLNGGSPNQSFITGASGPPGVAVDGNYIYWTNTGNLVDGTIGRANLNGSSPNQFWRYGASTASGLAVDGNYLYFTQNSDGTIARYGLNGPPSSRFFITGATRPFGVAVDGNYIYWTNNRTIGRANLNGGSPNQSFITGASFLYGVAVDALNPAGSLDPAPNDYGSRLISSGPSAAATFTLSSTGNVNLTIPSSGIGLTGTDSDQFQVSGGTCAAGSSSLANTQSCTVTVTFDPSSTGAKSATLAVETNAGSKSAALTGIGTNPAGSLDPASNDFGSRLVGTETGATFTLSSSGSADLDIEGMGIGGSGGGNFGLLNYGTCSVAATQLSNGQSCTVIVNFSPTSTGAKSATLDITTNDGLKSVALSGTGTANPTISSVGKPTKRSLKVKVGCGDASACSLRLTGKKVGTNAAITPKTVAVGAGQQPTVTLAYTRPLKTALARGESVNVTATNSATGGAKSITVRVAR